MDLSVLESFFEEAERRNIKYTLTLHFLLALSNHLSNY